MEFVSRDASYDSRTFLDARRRVLSVRLQRREQRTNLVPETRLRREAHQPAAATAARERENSPDQFSNYRRQMERITEIGKFHDTQRFLRKSLALDRETFQKRKR